MIVIRIQNHGIFALLSLLAAVTTFSSAGFADHFSTGKDVILRNGAPFVVKGVVYVPAYPGYLPWELAEKDEIPKELKHSIRQDLQSIKAMGANTIRLWDAPPYVYQAIREIGGLAIIQTIWFDVTQNDLQDEAFKKRCQMTIQKIIGRIYDSYGSDTPPILAYLAGNELSNKSIHSTNEKHPEISEYEGEYVSAPKGSSAAECFLAEMADFLKGYEFKKYGRTGLVSYANEVRTAQAIDTPFLDFRSFNGYSNSIHDDVTPKEGSAAKSAFQGWIETLKSQYPDKPLLITETGLSVSPGAPRVGPPDYGYGANTEIEQAEALLERWKDVTTANPAAAGMCVHEFLDAWWKFGLKDSLTQDPNDVEEWFGLAAIKPKGKWYKTKLRPSYNRLKAVWTN